MNLTLHFSTPPTPNTAKHHFEFVGIFPLKYNKPKKYRIQPEVIFTKATLHEKEKRRLKYIKEHAL